MVNEPAKEWIEIKGIKYRVDRDLFISEDESHVLFLEVNYTWLSGYYKRKGIWSKDQPCNLHRAVWEANFGPIPTGHHIHHKDANRKNNHIENLQCLEGRLHLSRSAKKSTWVGSQGNLEVLKKMREMARPWHQSKEGKEFHRQHAKNIKFGYKPVSFDRKCKHCNKDYQAHQTKGEYCSRKCKTLFRYHSGIDNENRQCIYCNKYFIVNRYSKTMTCGGECKKRLWRESTGWPLS